MGEVIVSIALGAIPLIFAITVHEVMHGYAAKRLGDLTAYRAGRLTLNPIAHIDPVGTIVVPLVMLIFQGLIGAGSIILFGWAKPVPINVSALKNPKRDMCWVALAGPASNVAMAVFWGYLAVYAGDWGLGALSAFLQGAGRLGVIYNVAFAALNLIPIPPLDGSRVVAGLLPSPLSERYAGLEPYGFPILLLLMVTGLLWPLMSPLVSLIGKILDFLII